MTSGSRSSAQYLGDVVQAIDQILEYTEGQDLEAFGRSRITQDAVARNFEIMGEAFRQLAHKHPDFTARHPELPVTASAGMRNIIAHAYWTVAVPTMWNTIRQQLPDLRRLVTALAGSSDS